MMNKKGKVLVLFGFVVILTLLLSFSLAGKGNGKPGPKACNDHLDNDGDGLVDLADPGCQNRKDNSELGMNACDDGIDNDGDGSIDTNDVGCSSAADTDETNCGDGVISGTEVCDGSQLSGETCSSQGFDGGTLSCNTACTGLVTTSCWTDSCTDSDNGIDEWNFGSTSGSTSGVSFEHDDYCSGVVLIENYCNANTPSTTWFDCSSNGTTTCSNGACIA